MKHDKENHTRRPNIIRFWVEFVKCVKSIHRMYSLWRGRLNSADKVAYKLIWRIKNHPVSEINQMNVI